jgi:mannose/fructose/N-acetylgalactosamine-specific phosphotransferase system component IIC
MPDAPILIALIAWGGLVGMDLVSFPQAMFNRPVVAGTVAGLLTGDLEAGLRIGVLLELFALEVLPIGASRYPDFGPATVAAATAAAGGPWREALGPAVLLALVLAKVGGRTMELLGAGMAHRCGRPSLPWPRATPRCWRACSSSAWRAICSGARP